MRIRQIRMRGNVRWVVDFKDGKGRRRRRFFIDHTSALVFSQTITHDVPTRQRGPGISTRFLFNAYLTQTRSRRAPTVQHCVELRGRQIIVALDKLDVRYASQLSVEVFNLLVAAFRARGLRETTVYDYMACYRAMFRWGVRHGLLAPVPLDDMVIPLPQRVPERHLSMAEITVLMEHMGGNVLELPAALGIYQGLRRGEACRLRVGDLDLSSNRLTVTESKTRRWRTIQMHDKLRARLPQPLPARDFLCLNTKGGPSKPQWLTHAFRDIVDELGPDWRNVTFHTLRHTCASQMAASGKYTLYQIARFLGHRSIQTTQKYAHLLPDQLKPDW